MGVEVRGLEDVQRMLTELADEFPKAAVYAQNRMAFALRDASVLQMAADFDGATGYSRAAIRYQRAELGVRGARVYLRDERGNPADEGHYLNANTLGGKRTRNRASELSFQAMGVMPNGWVWIPTNHVKRDKYGNVTAAKMRSIIASIRSKDGVYVYDPGSHGTRSFPGIWTAKGPEAVIRGGWTPVLFFMPPRQYRARYDFFGRAEREINNDLVKILDEELARAIDKAKR